MSISLSRYITKEREREREREKKETELRHDHLSLSLSLCAWVFLLSFRKKKNVPDDDDVCCCISMKRARDVCPERENESARIRWRREEWKRAENPEATSMNDTHML